MKIYNLTIAIIALVAILSMYYKEIKKDKVNLNNIIGISFFVIPILISIIFQVILL